MSIISVFKIFFICILLALVVPKEGLALTSSPVRLELAGDAGTSVDGEFELYNDARETKTYSIRFANFEGQGESGMAVPVQTPGGLASWLRAETTVVEMKPLERRKIRVQADIPFNADPGGYLAGVIAGNPERGEQGQSEIAVNAQVGTLILLRVNGEFVEGADILEFEVADGHGRSLPVDFYYRFQNKGQSWVKPLGDVVIHNWLGNTTKIVPANPDGGNVLPRSVRRFTTSWLDRNGETQDMKATRPEDLPPGYWNRVRHEFKHFAFGRYRADLTLTYGDIEQKRTQKSVVFWVLPWEIILTVLGGLVIILGSLTALAVWIAMKIVRRRTRPRE